MLNTAGAERFFDALLLVVDDFVHFDSVHFRQGRGELVERVGVLGEYGLELDVLGIGGERRQSLHYRHKFLRCESAVVFEFVCPQVLVALDGVENVQGEVE